LIKSRNSWHPDLEDNVSEENILSMSFQGVYPGGGGIVKTTAVVVSSASALDDRRSTQHPWSGGSEGDITPETNIEDRV
jgi:hypothetical protein